MQPQVIRCDAWLRSHRRCSHPNCSATSLKRGGSGVSLIDRPEWTHQRPLVLTREGGKCVSILNSIRQWFVQPCDPASLHRVLHFRGLGMQTCFSSVTTWAVVDECCSYYQPQLCFHPVWHLMQRHMRWSRNPRVSWSDWVPCGATAPSRAENQRTNLMRRLIIHVTVIL